MKCSRTVYKLFMNSVCQTGSGKLITLLLLPLLLLLLLLQSRMKNATAHVGPVDLAAAFYGGFVLLAEIGRAHV